MFKRVNNAWGDSILYEDTGLVTNLNKDVEAFCSMCIKKDFMGMWMS